MLFWGFLFRFFRFIREGSGFSLGLFWFFVFVFLILQGRLVFFQVFKYRNWLGIFISIIIVFRGIQTVYVFFQRIIQNLVIISQVFWVSDFDRVVLLFILQIGVGKVDFRGTEKVRGSIQSRFIGLFFFFYRGLCRIYSCRQTYVDNGNNNRSESILRSLQVLRILYIFVYLIFVKRFVRFSAYSGFLLDVC